MGSVNLAAACHFLQSFRMNAEQTGSLFTIKERFKFS
jgi:hypothetical protein